jgi:APA family basic amino acid/polyamine antiporter
LGAKATVFVREATGLVRSMNWVDLLYLNVVSFGGAWSIIYALTYIPYYGGDPAFSLLLTAPGILALLGVYYIFNASMPRSGGDYVYTSRILHPSLGLAANWVGYTIFLWFWIADAASVFSSSGLAQTLSVYGALTNSSWAIGAASWFSAPINNFALGFVVILGFASIVMLKTRLYFYIQNVLMTIAVVGLVIIAFLLVIASVNPSLFISNFNSYAASVGAKLAPTAYSNISLSAAPYVPDTSVSNLGANVLLVPLWFTVLFWVFVSNYCGGETKNAKSTAKRALFGSFAIIFLATLTILELAYKALGVNFIYGADNMYYGYVPNPLGVLPNLTLFAGILASNPVLVLFLGVGIVAGFILVVPQCMILMSRILFAYSFDRVAPTSLADVNSRFHTPVKAILVAAVGGVVMLLFLSGVLGPANSATAFALYSYAGLATVGLTFTVVSITAILFPYRRRQLYEVASITKRKVLGLPVITWLGIVSLVYSAGTIIWYTYDQNFYFFGCPYGGVVACDYNYFLIILGVLFVGTILAYFGIRRYRNRQGVPFDMTFAEIPPE